MGLVGTISKGPAKAKKKKLSIEIPVDPPEPTDKTSAKLSALRDDISVLAAARKAAQEVHAVAREALAEFVPAAASAKDAAREVFAEVPPAVLGQRC